MKLNTAFWLSIILSIAGCFGIVLAGRGKWYGWALGLAAQPVWITFGVITKGYGICLTSVLYASVYGRNLVDWRRRHAA